MGLHRAELSVLFCIDVLVRQYGTEHWWGANLQGRKGKTVCTPGTTTSYKHPVHSGEKSDGTSETPTLGVSMTSRASASQGPNHTHAVEWPSRKSEGTGEPPDPLHRPNGAMSQRDPVKCDSENRCCVGGKVADGGMCNPHAVAAIHDDRRP